MNHIMLDLETMDNKPTAAIVAIGAVVFDPDNGTLGKRLYLRVNLEDSQKHGGTLSAETVKWWLRQSAEARAELVTEDSLTISRALGELQCFILRHCSMNKMRIWAKGMDFDLPIIYSALDRSCLPPVWSYWNVRDVRTLTEVATAAGIDFRTAVPREGIAHNALDDAIHQAQTVNYVWKSLVTPPLNTADNEANKS